jgi:hypothetical protein
MEELRFQSESIHYINSTGIIAELPLSFIYPVIAPPLQYCICNNNFRVGIPQLHQEFLIPLLFYSPKCKDDFTCNSQIFSSSVARLLLCKLIEHSCDSYCVDNKYCRKSFINVPCTKPAYSVSKIGKKFPKYKNDHVLGMYKLYMRKISKFFVITNK